VSVAVGLTPLKTRRDVVLHVATRAESVGYDAFFLAEGWGHEASVLLAEVAARTSRIRIGTGVLNVWGRSAAQIAMVATSLDEFSDGQLVLGLGAGSPALAEGLHDVAFRAPVPRLAAVARQVRGLLDGGRVAPASGGRGLRLAVGPSPVPILLAALGGRGRDLPGPGTGRPGGAHGVGTYQEVARSMGAGAVQGGGLGEAGEPGCHGVARPARGGRGILVAGCASAFGDSYCALAWGSKLAAVTDADTASGVLRGEDDSLASSAQAMAGWARKATRNPATPSRPTCRHCATPDTAILRSSPSPRS
jgi:alkanesulfonate monooxygenase SsuD/methylene tetrahydromethanopterin reductase-like flavin-dependent oxidoreductase (luciferase family)